MHRGSGLAVIVVAWAAASCVPARYQLALPPGRPGLGSEERPCIFVEDPSWRPGQLATPVCGAWTDQSQSDLMPHDWVFFPHRLVGDGRTGRCDACWLDVKTPEPGRWVVEARGPGDAVLAVWEGPLVDGRFHGEGRLTLRRTPDCVRSCQDVFVVGDGIARELSLQGWWDGGSLDPRRPIRAGWTLDSGASFDGEARRDGVRGVIGHGEGLRIAANGGTLMGRFVDGLASGPGEQVDPEEGRYTGTFARGLRHGEGELVRPDGSVHRGAWREGLPHGPGTLVTAGGVEIDGDWDAGALGPQVRIRWPDGARYEGQAVDQTPHGVGVWVWPDGLVYSGAIERGRPSGLGALHWPDGRRYVGAWTDARREGCGVYVGPGASPWAGTWADDLPVASACSPLPTAWTSAQLATLGESPPDARALLDPLMAQARTNAAKADAELRREQLRARLQPAPTPDDPDVRLVQIGFTWPAERAQRMFHPRCLAEDALTLTVDGATVKPSLGGDLDARAAVWLPRGTTSRVCATIAGPCGAGSGCAPVDVPSEQASGPVRARLLLDPREAADD